jgi:hypothetical protein
MNTYHMASEETGLQVVESYAGLQRRFHGSFSSERAASDWVTIHLSPINTVDLTRWVREWAA